jgi:hypothetical protein
MCESATSKRVCGAGLGLASLGQKSSKNALLHESSQLTSRIVDMVLLILHLASFGRAFMQQVDKLDSEGINFLEPLQSTQSIDAISVFHTVF